MPLATSSLVKVVLDGPPPGTAPCRDRENEAPARAPQPLLLGIPMFIFGIQHYMYVDFVITLMPEWIAGRRFWAYSPAPR